MNRSLSYSGSLLVALLAATQPASADRPGTPNNEKAYPCGVPENAVKGGYPNVCVEFNNTASEPVRFDVETTLNGAPLAANRPKADCFHDEPIRGKRGQGCIGCEVGGFHGSIYGCEVATHYNSGGGPPAVGKTGDTRSNKSVVLPQGFVLRNLEYNSTYCFRLKARRVSDDMVSERWSNRVCATTGQPSKPVKPSAPINVAADFVRGGPTSSKVIVKWKVHQPHYSTEVHVYKKYYDEPDSEYVEVTNEDRNSAVDTLVDIMTKDELRSGGSTRIPSIHYKVCLQKTGGTACARPVSSFTPGKGIETAPQGDVTNKTPPVQVDAAPPGDVIGHTPPAGVETEADVVAPPAKNKSGIITRRPNVIRKPDVIVR